jgi:DedD protein
MRFAYCTLQLLHPSYGKLEVHQKMAKQLSDDEQNLRRKARRRLIGAFALTLAVVVLLPMVLDSEPKPTGLDIDLRIPSPDEAGAFAPKMAVSDVPDVKPSGEPPVVPAVTPPAPGKTPAVAGNSAIKAAGKEQPAADRKEGAGGSDKPVAEGFVAQVGAYSNADTAKQELGKLKKWGFKAYSEKAGDMIRVRVGPYADREKAEKVRLQLEKHGLHPVVMNAKGS